MWAKIKSNKYVMYGGAVVLLIVVFILVRRSTGGSSAGTVVTSGPTDAQVASQTQLALAQMQLQGQQSQSSADYAIQTLQVQADLSKASLSADLQKYAIDKDAQNQAAQIAFQNASDARNADLQASIAQHTLDTQLQMQTNNNSFQLDYATAANASAQAMAQIQAGVVAQQIQAGITQSQIAANVTNNQITANQNTTIAGLEAQTAQLSTYIGSQVAMNESNNAKDVATAQISAGVQKKQSSNNLIGGIIGGVLGLFSDRRLKRDIQLIGRDADGVGIYSYRYHDSKSFQIGYMADEIRAHRPWAMGPNILGYDTVNYAAT